MLLQYLKYIQAVSTSLKCTPWSVLWFGLVHRSEILNIAWSGGWDLIELCVGLI